MSRQDSPPSMDFNATPPQQPVNQVSRHVPDLLNGRTASVNPDNGFFRSITSAGYIEKNIYFSMAMRGAYFNIILYTF